MHVAKLGGALPVYRRTAQPAGAKPERRRAGPRADRPADARARRRYCFWMNPPTIWIFPRSRSSKTTWLEFPCALVLADPRSIPAQPRGNHGCGTRWTGAMPASSPISPSGNRWVEELAGKKQGRVPPGTFRSQALPPRGREPKPPKAVPARGRSSLAWKRGSLPRIEQRVEESDARLGAAHQRVNDPSIASNAGALQAALAELEAARLENDALYARWAELTEKAG